MEITCREYYDFYEVKANKDANFIKHNTSSVALFMSLLAAAMLLGFCHIKLKAEGCDLPVFLGIVSTAVCLY